jgi:hypothetical protein
MDIQRAFTFLWQDPDWLRKLGTGVALILISILLSPILIGILGFFILTGYSVRLLQNVRDGVPYPMPEWDQWGEDMVNGLKLGGAFVLYSIPIFIAMIPTVLGAALTEESGAGNLIGVPLLVVGICLTVLYGLFLAVAQPGITLAFARDLRFGSALDFSAVWEWTRANIGPVIIVTLVYLAASAVLPFAATLIGALLCIVGLIVTIPLATLALTLMQAHLFGQLAANYPMEGSAPLPPAAPPAPEPMSAPPTAPVAPPFDPSVPVDPFPAAPSPSAPSPSAPSSGAPSPSAPSSGAPSSAQTLDAGIDPDVDSAVDVNLPPAQPGSDADDPWRSG